MLNRFPRPGTTLRKVNNNLIKIKKYFSTVCR